MPVTIITSQDDHAETRYHADVMRVSQVLRGIPEWIACRPTQGGSHSVATCERCANAARLRALFASASVNECEAMRSEDNVQSQSQRDEYVADRDQHLQVRRQCERYLRIAQATPERKLPKAIRELRVVAATHRTHRDLGVGAHAQTLYMYATMAADIAWERYRLAYHAS